MSQPTQNPQPTQNRQPQTPQTQPSQAQPPRNPRNPRNQIKPEDVTKQLAPPERKNTSQITQAEYITNPVKMPDIITRTIFSTSTVKNMTDGDFNLSSKDMITINDDNCTLILFYVENEESKQLATIWAISAQQTAGPIFGAVNLLHEKKVAETFMKLKSMNGHPLHSYSLRGYPFILVYRGGWPVAFYNGSRTVNAIIDYALTLACNIDYSEPVSLGAGMQAEYQLEIGSYDVYSNLESLRGNKIRKNSLEYDNRGVRGFNPNLQPVLTGSNQEKEETLQKNEQILEEFKETQDQNTPVPAAPVTVKPK